MISIQDLKFYYRLGEFSLAIQEFAVTKGEKVAVIGPSGSGKTTLLNLIAGIITPIKGTVIVDDDRVSQLNDTGRRDFRITNIGFVFQDFELLDYLNVFEAMGIGDKLKRNANDLSHGEKQRAAICRALLPQPKLILADEATGNLDPENKMLILDLLFRAVEEHDATLLAVTHDHELLKRFSRVIDFDDFQGRFI
jgi:putative ABC transport system ATP-binding protein